jgi:putative hydrolase of HD superfamily
MNSKSNGNHAPFIDHGRLNGLLAFFQAAEQLKDTLRSGTSRSGRAESTAEHSWRLCLMVLLFEKDIVGVDIKKLLKLCVLHDLGEAISGDVPAPHQSDGDNRQERERRDFQALCADLPDDVASDFMVLWDEYADAVTPEAQLAKAFDKLETMLQHQLMPAADADADFHAFNLSYGRDRTEVFPLTRQIRERVDARTKELINDRKSAQNA